MELNTPILFIAFNRPDTTKIVFVNFKNILIKHKYFKAIINNTIITIEAYLH